MSPLEDPRVQFAAERTLLAWLRTAVTVMGFGFVVAKFGLYPQLNVGRDPSVAQTAALAIGVALVAFAVLASITSALQYRHVLRSLGPAEIPPRYRTGVAALAAWALAALGVLVALDLAIF